MKYKCISLIRENTYMFIGDWKLLVDFLHKNKKRIFDLGVLMIRRDGLQKEEQYDITLD